MNLDEMERIMSCKLSEDDPLPDPNFNLVTETRKLINRVRELESAVREAANILELVSQRDCITGKDAKEWLSRHAKKGTE